MSKKLKREIIIPADTELVSGVSKVVFVEKTYEITIGIGKDHTAVLYIGEEALKELSKYKNELSI